jgi:hypothetical protein
MDFSKHTDGTTSVKVHHAPGGKSNFSLGWDEAPKAPKSTPVQPPAQQQQPASNQPKQAVSSNNATAGYSDKSKQEPAGKTSVKVHNPPGGKSNFTLG